jgi:hypothetical protein
VLSVDPVADVALLGQGLEAVEEPGRDVEVGELDVVQGDREVLTVGR